MEPNVLISKDDDGNIVIDDRSVWSARKTKSVFLREWNIVDSVTTNSSHFIGVDILDGTGRLSTNIQSITEQKTYIRDGKEIDCWGAAITQSGTEYVLLGDPGRLGSNASYLFNRVLGAHRDKITFRFDLK